MNLSHAQLVAHGPDRRLTPPALLMDEQPLTGHEHNTGGSGRNTLATLLNSSPPPLPGQQPGTFNSYGCNSPSQSWSSLLDGSHMADQQDFSGAP